MKNKFNIGDKVQIRKDLEAGSCYGGLTLFDGKMSSYRGQICTVAGATRQGNYDVVENPFVWSEEMLVRCHEDKVIFSDKATVLIKDGKKYVSKCKDGDTYDKEKGLLLCLAQANGISYRDLQEMIAGAKDCNAEKAKAFAAALNGDKKAGDKAKVRKVKREAKVGEYIKIVRAYAAHGLYKNGDIFKVYKTASLGGVYCDMPKKTEAYARDNGNIIIWHGEYVVLENYKPYKITLSEFLEKGAKIAVNLKTDAEYAVFMKACKKRGHFEGWRGKRTITEKDFCLSRLLGYGYCDAEWYKKEGCTVYNFDEVDLEN